jgi:hypothetical protein
MLAPTKTAKNLEASHNGEIVGSREGTRGTAEELQVANGKLKIRMRETRAVNH